MLMGSLRHNIVTSACSIKLPILQNKLRVVNNTSLHIFLLITLLFSPDNSLVFPTFNIYSQRQYRLHQTLAIYNTFSALLLKQTHKQLRHIQ